MFVSVIKNFNVFWKGQRFTCDFKIIPVFYSLDDILDISRNDSVRNSRVKK